MLFFMQSQYPTGPAGVAWAHIFSEYRNFRRGGSFERIYYAVAYHYYLEVNGLSFREFSFEEWCKLRDIVLDELEGL